MSNNECNTNILREVLYKYAGMGAHLFPLCWPEWNDTAMYIVDMAIAMIKVNQNKTISGKRHY